MISYDMEQAGSGSEKAGGFPSSFPRNEENISTDNFFTIANLGDDGDKELVLGDVDSGLGQSSGARLRESEESTDIYNESDDEPRDTKGESKQDRKYRAASLVFFGISMFSAFCILACEAYMYAAINIHKANLNSEDSYAELSIYLALFIFAAIYQVLLSVVGLRTKNMLLLAGLCMFYACMVIYTGIQYDEVKKVLGSDMAAVWRQATRATNIATIAVLAATLVAHVLILYFVLQKNVKWFRYKKIGGDFGIRRMYSVFQIHRTLLIFDFFFFVGFTIQFLVIMVKDKLSVEFILTVCVLPLTILLLLAADIAGSREWVVLSVATVVVFFGGIVYVLFKMVRLYTKYTSAFLLTIHPGDYFPGRKSLLTFGILTLLLLVTTIGVEITMIRNYKRGLLPLVSTYYKFLPGHKADKRRAADITM